MLGSPVLSFAADISQPPLPTVSTFSSLLRMLMGLGVVLVVMAGLVWLLKKSPLGQPGGVGALRVVSAVAVGPKERVVLVDVGETRLVLGVAPGHVVRLLEMERPDEADVVTTEKTVPSFVARLKEVMAARGVSK
ncbi:MAG TPA: flagellar biosynthetic protein FliO [Methylophilaceae bacterium]